MFKRWYSALSNFVIDKELKVLHASLIQTHIYFWGLIHFTTQRDVCRKLDKPHWHFGTRPTSTLEAYNYTPEYIVEKLFANNYEGQRILKDYLDEKSNSDETQ